MIALQEKVDKLLTEFQGLEDWEVRYKKIIDMGKSLPEMDEKYKTEANKIKGCQSQVWLHAYLVEGRVVFVADSDASIVKGIIALLLKIYSHSTPQEILSFKADFIDQLGLRQHLSMNRTNGLAAMLKQIQMYAFAFQTLLASKA
jgi:cysteine desulfuration protein SufE